MTTTGKPLDGPVGCCFSTLQAKDYGAVLSFQNAEVSVQRGSYYDGLAFDPSMSITQILYQARDLQPYSQWRGFTADQTQPVCFKIWAS